MAVKFTKSEINIAEKVAELDKPSGIAGEAMLRADTPQEQFNLIGAGRRNLFINGAFEIFQRGAGPASPTSGNLPATADRWHIPNTSEVTEVVANDRASHLTKMLKVTANSSGYGQLAQWIENARTAAGQSVTISCWLKSPTVGPMRFHIYQNFGSGGSSTVSVIDDSSYFNIDFANTWQRFETTIEIPSVTGKTIGAGSYIAIQMGAPSAIANRIVYYSEMQAELGKVATPFEHRSYGEEFALCQRYYRRYETPNSSYMPFINGNTFASTQFQASYDAIGMRNQPTLETNGTASDYQIYSGIGGQNATSVPYLDAQSRYPVLDIRVPISGATAGQGAWLRVNNNNNAFLAFDAEL